MIRDVDAGAVGFDVHHVLTVGLHASESVDDNREELTVSGIAIITEACIDVKDRAWAGSTGGCNGAVRVAVR